MKVIIAGPRDCQDYKLLCEALENCPFTDQITEIVSGGAKGIDKLGEKWGRDNGKKVSVFEAKWKEIEVEGAKVVEGKFGKYNALAGFWRNEDMARYCGPKGGLIAIDLDTDGTRHMIEEARNCLLQVFTWPPKKATAANTVYDF